MIKNQKYGKFIVIEGLDGSGKTSAVKKIKTILQHHGIFQIISVRDPGSTPLSEKIRFLVKNKKNKEIIHNRTELLMFYAARIQLVKNIIQPSLSKGTWVISDRFYLSSRAYQGAGRRINQDIIKILETFSLYNCLPDLTLYLEVSPEIGLSRISIRKKMDRFETESLDFFYRVQKKYKKLINLEKNVIVIDANQPKNNVHKIIQKEIIQWMRKKIIF